MKGSREVLVVTLLPFYHQKMEEIQGNNLAICRGENHWFEPCKMEVL